MTIKELALDTHEKVWEVSCTMEKVRFLSSELYNELTDIEDGTDYNKACMYYYNKPRHESFASLLMDYTYDMEQALEKILEYLDSPQFKEVLADGEKGFKGSSTTGK